MIFNPTYKIKTEIDYLKGLTNHKDIIANMYFFRLLNEFILIL